MKTLFFGTPALAVPYLELLAERSQVLAVVSQPDRPSGRGLSGEPTPVKKAALARGLRVLQPEKPLAVASELKALGAELAVVVAYGRLLKPELLAGTVHGFLNVHFSLLPKYRGAAPVQWILARGEQRSGVSLFWLDEGMDTGPIQLQRELAVSPDDDAGSLFERLVPLGVQALSEGLDQIAAGTIRREPQQGEPSLAPLIKREDAALALSMTAEEIHNRVRGFRLWPKARLGAVMLLKTRLAGTADSPALGRPGAILFVDRNGPILVECGRSSRLWFLTVQPEGKKPLTAAEFINGLRLKAGDSLPVGT